MVKSGYRQSKIIVAWVLVKFILLLNRKEEPFQKKISSKNNFLIK